MQKCFMYKPFLYTKRVTLHLHTTIFIPNRTFTICLIIFLFIAATSTFLAAGGVVVSITAVAGLHSSNDIGNFVEHQKGRGWRCIGLCRLRWRWRFFALSCLRIGGGCGVFINQIHRSTGARLSQGVANYVGSLEAGKALAVRRR